MRVTLLAIMSIVRVTGGIAAWSSSRYVVLGFQAGGIGATKKSLVMAFDTHVQVPRVVPISARAAKIIRRFTDDDAIERAINAALDREDARGGKT